jgi:hypothetical protein
MQRMQGTFYDNRYCESCFGDMEKNGSAHLQTRADTEIPISKHRLDIAAYTYSYNMENGCHPSNDEFWKNEKMRLMLLKLRFEEHSWSHSRSCFKKVCQLQNI